MSTRLGSSSNLIEFRAAGVKKGHPPHHVFFVLFVAKRLTKPFHPSRQPSRTRGRGRDVDVSRPPVQSILHAPSCLKLRQRGRSRCASDAATLKSRRASSPHRSATPLQTAHRARRRRSPIRGRLLQIA